MSDQCQDMSTPEAREAHYKACWEQAAAAGNKAREMLSKVITNGLTLPLERDIRNLLGPYMFAAPKQEDAPCPNCDGTGLYGSTQCDECDGQGVVSK